MQYIRTSLFSDAFHFTTLFGFCLAFELRLQSICLRSCFRQLWGWGPYWHFVRLAVFPDPFMQLSSRPTYSAAQQTDNETFNDLQGTVERNKSCWPQLRSTGDLSSLSLYRSTQLKLVDKQNATTSRKLSNLSRRWPTIPTYHRLSRHP